MRQQAVSIGATERGRGQQRGGKWGRKGRRKGNGGKGEEGVREERAQLGERLERNRKVEMGHFWPEGQHGGEY